MTNGEPLVVKGAIKPISTLTKPLRSVDTETKEPAQAMRERTDSTVVPAAGVVAEAMVALVLARCYREKFGGDHIDDVIRRASLLRGAHRMAPLDAEAGPAPRANDRLRRLHGGREDAAAKGARCGLGAREDVDRRSSASSARRR